MKPASNKQEHTRKIAKPIFLACESPLGFWTHNLVDRRIGSECPSCKAWLKHETTFRWSEVADLLPFLIALVWLKSVPLPMTARVAIVVALVVGCASLLHLISVTARFTIVYSHGTGYPLVPPDVPAATSRLQGLR